MVDFTFLDGVFSNTPERYKELIAMMIPEFEEYQSILSQAIDTNDEVTINRQHHKLKAQIQSLKLQQLDAKISDIKKNLSTYSPNQRMQEKKELDNCLESIVEQLKQKQQA